MKTLGIFFFILSILNTPVVMTYFFNSTLYRPIEFYHHEVMSYFTFGTIGRDSFGAEYVHLDILNGVTDYTCPAVTSQRKRDAPTKPDLIKNNVRLECRFKSKIKEINDIGFVNAIDLDDKATNMTQIRTNIKQPHFYPIAWNLYNDTEIVEKQKYEDQYGINQN